MAAFSSRWVTVAIGALAGAEASFVLTGAVTGPGRVVALAAALALAALVGYRLGRADVLSSLKRTTAPLPAKVTLTFADNGSLSALVQRMDGDLATMQVPDEVAELGPQAAFRWVFEHSVDA